MKIICALIIIGSLGIASSIVFAQDPNTLSVNLDLVLVPVTVMDSHGTHVTGLERDAFSVWEDRVEQIVESFSAENLPISLGVILDISHSMRASAATARDAAGKFLGISETEDEYFLVEFSDHPELAQDFTTDIDSLQNRLIFTAATGQTALYDAIYLGVEKVKTGRNPRKALLVITDGADNHSHYSFSDLKQLAIESDAQIFSIGLKSGYGRAFLTDLAEVTGGKAFFPDSATDLDKVCDAIATELKNQYLLGYVSSNASRDGKWRKIAVRVSSPPGISHLTTHARAGYFAPAF